MAHGPAEGALRVGSRASPLARIQAERVLARLKAVRLALSLEWVGVRTEGDRDRRRPLTAFADVGVFVRALERALREGRIDLAVHSAKDVPTDLPPDLVLAAFPERGPVWDVLVSPHRPAPGGDGLAGLPPRARVATGSVRRRAQLLRWRPDLEVRGLRGNVHTRLRQLFDQGLDGIVLAAAGLARLGLLPEGPPEPAAVELPGARARAWVIPLDPARFVPAPGQGALAVEVRTGDTAVRQPVAAVDDPAVAAAVRAERAFLAGVGATCAVPVGAFGRVDGGRLVLHAYYEQAPEPYAEAAGAVDEAEAIGARLAARLVAAAEAGAGE